MGTMGFTVSLPDRVTQRTVDRAYLAGIDRLAWQVRTTLLDDEFFMQRSVPDSARLHIPWPIPEHGRPVLATGSLIERPTPYRLPLELARGTVGGLRNQMAEWEMLGLAIPDQVVQLSREAVRRFGHAAVTADDERASAEEAEEAVRIALDAGQLLTTAYVEQAIAVRRRETPQLQMMLGGDLGGSLLDDKTAGAFLQTFNAAVIPASWREIEMVEGNYRWDICDRQIEWCRTHGLKVCLGPLVQLAPQRLPDWLYLWEGDFENVVSFASDFIRAVVTRYRGKVDVWQCAGRANSAQLLGLSEPQKLRLAAHTIELTQSLDPDTTTVLSFDQPWAEYLSRRAVDFPPLHFADALVRAGLNLGGLMLELHWGYYPDGTQPRTLLDFSRHLDYWAMLGLPLYVSLAVPSASDDDPLARQPNQLVAEDPTPASQQAWVARHVPLLLSKPYVHGVLWSDLRDNEPHDFPHGGLIDAQQSPKPAMGTLGAIRKRYLG